MSLALFTFTQRARPFVELGVGEQRVPTGQARWDTARWDTATDLWAGTVPYWLDITCDTHEAMCEYGRQRVVDRFAVGEATLVVNNATGWADPTRPADDVEGTVSMRPGRRIRFGVDHVVLGRCVLWQGVIDEVVPTYTPAPYDDAVQLHVIDALGEVNRAKLKALADPVGVGERASARIQRILDAALWPAEWRSIDDSSTALLGTTLGGQVADMLGATADSAGGAVFGDLSGRLCFRGRDWQTYLPTEPNDGTIGNVEPTDVCPVAWERPYRRADIATRVLLGREGDAVVQLDDLPAQAIFGIEPYERLDLLTMGDPDLLRLAQRQLQVRSADTAPRVRSVSLDASTSAAALDLMATVDPYEPSRYRCRLRQERGDVFDAEHFATGVRHELTRDSWTLQLNLDLAGQYEAAGARWDRGLGWDRDTWAEVAPLAERAHELLARIEATA